MTLPFSNRQSALHRGNIIRLSLRKQRVELTALAGYLIRIDESNMWPQLACIPRIVVSAFWGTLRVLKECELLLTSI